MKTSALTSVVLLGLSSTVVQAIQIPSGMLPVGSNYFETDRANFTMINSMGSTFGGTNNVNMRWDGTVFTDISDYTGPGSISNATVSSSTTFFGAQWAAHDVQIFSPGSYTFDVTLGGGNGETGTMGMNVASNQLGVCRV